MDKHTNNMSSIYWFAMEEIEKEKEHIEEMSAKLKEENERLRKRLDIASAKIIVLEVFNKVVKEVMEQSIK